MTPELKQQIATDTYRTRTSTGIASISPQVMRAMEKVDRSYFVDAEYRADSWQNRPLPIAAGQTISQPFIVALMTECLFRHGASKVLEVGTGCGYQTAILAELFDQVYSVEIIPQLADTAKGKLESLGYNNISLALANGRNGWPDASPFEGIMVTAAAETIPDALLDQLSEYGRLVIPLEDSAFAQQLSIVDTRGDEPPRIEPILAVRFVPLTGKG